MFNFGAVPTFSGGAVPTFSNTFGASATAFDIPSAITRTNLVKYLQELLIETELIRTKLASFHKQAKTASQFASLISDFVEEQRSGYSKGTIHSTILDILNQPHQQIPGFAHATGFTFGGPFGGGSGTGFSFGVNTQESSHPPEINRQVTRATEFNSQVFETLVERNSQLGKAINKNSTQQSFNHEEIMQQYQDCNKLAKLWIMQDLSEQFKVDRNEWKDNLLLVNLPFDIKFEIISFIPIEGYKAWWAQYLRFRIISNSMKQRLERAMFSKITREGINFSTLSVSEETNQSVRTFLTCHSDFENSKLEGTEFNGFCGTQNSQKQVWLSKGKKGKFTFNERDIPPLENAAIQPKERVIESIDHSKMFDTDYIEKVIDEISNEANERYTPFEKHVYSEGYVIPHQALAVSQSYSPFTSLTTFQNSFIKHVIVNLGTLSWLNGLTEIEELTLLVDVTDFIPSIQQSFHLFNLKKLKKFNLVIYAKSGFSWQMIELLMEKTLDFGGILTIYADMDNEYLNPFNGPSFETSIFCLDQVIKTSLDFKDLKLVLKPIQEFSVTKEILEKGWYRPLKKLSTQMKPPSHSVEAEKIKDPIFAADFFNTHQKKELIKYFANYGYPFDWHNCKTQFDEAFVQYYLHLLNVNQARLSYHGSVNPCDRSRKLLDLIVWGYDITICPEVIFNLCTVFGNIGVKLTIEKLKNNPNYITLYRFNSLIQEYGNSRMAIYYLAQLIPYIQNRENLDMIEIVDSQPEVLSSFILENYCDLNYLESENNNGVPKFIVLLQTTISNSIIERLARKYPKLLYQKSVNDQIPLHHCFTNKLRYKLIKPFIEIAPETIQYEDKFGYKPYHLIPEYLDHETELKTVDFELDFFQNHILPESLNHILLGKKF